LIWWSFSSCTSTIDVIKHFLGNKGPRTIINIECDSAKDISRHSFYQIENEILLYPARQFKVISSLDTGNRLQIIQLKEIQPPFPLIHIPQITSTLAPTIHLPPVNDSYQNQKLKDFIEKYQRESEIDLHDQDLSDEDMQIVVKEAIINKQCRKLRLQVNEITSAGASIIAKALNKNTTLEELWLSYNNVGDMGVHFLTKTLSLNNSLLRELHLIATEITDEGAGYLAEMLKTNSALLYVNLDGNNIGNRGIESLITTLIHYNRTLKRINLNRNKFVSDASVDFLVEMVKQDCSLSHLYISDCNLSEKGKEKLRQTTQKKKDFSLVV
jgi:hypothetical protein